MVESGFSDTTTDWVQTAYGVCCAIGQFGSMAANLRAGQVLGKSGWREVFLVTGVVVIVAGTVQGLYLINRP